MLRTIAGWKVEVSVAGFASACGERADPRHSVVPRFGRAEGEHEHQAPYVGRALRKRAGGAALDVASSTLGEVAVKLALLLGTPDGLRGNFRRLECPNHARKLVGTEGFSVDVASLSDVASLEALIERSARALCRSDYSGRQIEAALGSAWGVDTQLIKDGTYYRIRADSQIVACGGWSFRATPFGGDEGDQRDSRLLRPPGNAAKIRAFFVCPSFVRRGLGRLLLARCEAEARSRGFTHVELVATLTGARLYAAAGYRELSTEACELPGGVDVQFVQMGKVLGEAGNLDPVD